MDKIEPLIGTMKNLVRIVSIEPLNNFVVHLEFTDGVKREVDLEPFLHGNLFETLRNDIDVFRAVRVDERMGTIVWENSADIDPDMLYHNLTPAWMEEKE